MTSTELPTLAVIPGDPNGIGPELLARLLDDPETEEKANIIVVGDRHVIEYGFAAAGVEARPGSFQLRDVETIQADDLTPGEATRKGGESILATLTRALELAASGEVEGVLFMPFNKAAMHMADIGHEDEIRWMATWWGDRAGTVGELNIMAGLWSSRVTSHVPLKDVVSMITEETVLDAIRMLDGSLRASGVDSRALVSPPSTRMGGTAGISEPRKSISLHPQWRAPGNCRSRRMDPIRQIRCF